MQTWVWGLDPALILGVTLSRSLAPLGSTVLINRKEGLGHIANERDRSRQPLKAAEKKAEVQGRWVQALKWVPPLPIPSTCPAARHSHPLTHELVLG